VSVTCSPLDQLPTPSAIHERMGTLYRELMLLRRLLRLSQAAQGTRADHHAPNSRLPRQEATRER
jgi:hypothetical protein